MVLFKIPLFIFPKSDIQSIVIKVCSLFTKQVFLKILQNSPENICAGVCFNKFASVQPATSLNKRLQHRVFSCKFCEIFNNTYLTKHLRLTPSTPFLPTPKFDGSTPSTPKFEPRHQRYLGDPVFKYSRLQSFITLSAEVSLFRMQQYLVF